MNLTPLPGSAVLTRSAIGLTSSRASHQAARDGGWAVASGVTAHRMKHALMNNRFMVAPPILRLAPAGMRRAKGASPRALNGESSLFPLHIPKHLRIAHAIGSRVLQQREHADGVHAVAVHIRAPY